MGSAGDLERCTMYTAVGVSIVLPNDLIQYFGAYQCMWMSNMYFFSSHAVAVILLTWEAPRNYCTVSYFELFQVTVRAKGLRIGIGYYT